VAFTYLKVKSTKCVCLLTVVLVLVGLGLKNSVLLTSLEFTTFTVLDLESCNSHMEICDRMAAMVIGSLCVNSAS